MGELEARTRQVEHLKSQASTFKKDIARLKEDKAMLTKEIDALKARVNELETEKARAWDIELATSAS